MKRVLVINSRRMGTGSDELGDELMGKFLKTLWGQDDKPEGILFYNSGVMLLAKGSSVLDALEGLAEAGVDLIACGTCCTHFGITDDVTVGRVSDMKEIASILTGSSSVVTI